MADLNTAQRCRVTFKDTFGNSLSGTVTPTVSSDAVAVTMVGGVFIVAQHEGDATVTFDHSSGARGSVDVTVTPAPLTIILGAPEPK